MIETAPASARRTEAVPRPMFRPPASLDADERAAYLALAREINPTLAGNPRCALILQGSISEGFGNGASDVDILVLTEEDDGASMHRQHRFHGGRRVELWRRSAALQRAVADAVEQGAAGDPCAIPADLLHDYQQFCNGTVLQDAPVRARLAPRFSPGLIQRILAQRSAALARRYFARAQLLTAMDAGDLAQGALRAAGVQAAKHLALACGETYVKDKTVAMQVRRAGLERGLIEDVDLLLRAIRSNDATAAASARLMEAARLDPGDAVSEAEAALAPAVTPFAVGGRLYLFAGDAVFAVSPAAAAQIGAPGLTGGSARLSDLVKHAEQRSLLAALHRAGLAVIRHPGDPGGWRRIGPTPPSPTASFFLHPLGGEPATWPAGGLARLPVTPAVFAAAGAESCWARVVIDHCREDVIGAAPAGQWPLAEHALRRWGTALAQACLAAAGCTPLPPVEEVFIALDEIRAYDAELIRRIERLAEAAIVDAESCATVHREARLMTARLPLSDQMGEVEFTHANIYGRHLERDIGAAWISLAGSLGVATTIIDGAVFPAAEDIATGEQAK